MIYVITPPIRTNIPTINEIDVTSSTAIVSLTNEDNDAAFIYYNIDGSLTNFTQDNVFLEPAETSDPILFTGLDSETSYNINAVATAFNKRFSEQTTLPIITPEPEFPEYSLLADINITDAAVQQIEIDNFTILPEDNLRLVYTILTLNSNIQSVSVFLNDSETSDFRSQRMIVNGTSFDGFRGTVGLFAQLRSVEQLQGIADIKLSNTGEALLSIVNARAIAPHASSIRYQHHFTTSDTTFVNLNKITLVSSLSNGFGVGTKIRLYRTTGGAI